MLLQECLKEYYSPTVYEYSVYTSSLAQEIEDGGDGKDGLVGEMHEFEVSYEGEEDVDFFSGMGRLDGYVTKRVEWVGRP